MDSSRQPQSNFDETGRFIIASDNGVVDGIDRRYLRLLEARPRAAHR